MKNKKLLRPNKGRVIAGVAMGIAHYFEVDPVLIRAVFVLITVFGGSGVLLYVILWLIIPSEGSDGKLNENTIKENAHELREKVHEMARGGNGKYVLGILLLILGISLTFNNFGYFRFFDFGRLWPLLLIILAFVILKHDGRRK